MGHWNHLRIATIAFSVIIALLARENVYATVFLILYLGFLIVRVGRGYSFNIQLAVAPAIGFSVIIPTMHILSLLGLSLSLAYPIISITAVALSVVVPLKYKGDRRTILAIVGAISVSILPKLPFFRVPAYPGAVGHDAVFHAYKSLEVIKENTLFIHHFPPGFEGIVSYPAGYHSIIAFVSITSGVSVAEGMLAIKELTWMLIPLGTYAAASTIFKDKKIAVFSAFLAPVSYLYYYYLNYSLLQEFLDYYMVLSAVVFYNTLLKKPTHKNLLFSVLVISSTLLIHPYEYLAFEAYAMFILIAHILLRKGDLSKIALLFVLQAIISVSLYYLMEYPMRISPTSHLTYFGSPFYAAKDSLQWLLWATWKTFVNEGQIVLGVFFISGLGYIIKEKETHQWALLLFIAYIYFLALDKILIHVPIPYYSGIWSTERVYLLMTPVIPLIEGAGMYYIYNQIIRNAKQPLILTVSLALILIVPALYVNMWNVSFEEAACVDGNVLHVFNTLATLNKSTIITSTYLDSSAWIHVYLPERNVTSIRNVSMISRNISGVIYVDSRGCGDTVMTPFNPWNLLKDHHLIYFANNIWVFNASISIQGSVPPDVYKYYVLHNGIINVSNMKNWKYLSYGFLLRHPAIIYANMFGGGNISLVNSPEAVIAFVPTRGYSLIGLDVYMLNGKSRTVKVFINGEFIGTIDHDGYNAFKYQFTPGTLYLVTLRGKPWYAISLIKLGG